MKKGIIVYSSRTGNTKKIAEAFLEGQEEYFDIADLEEKPELNSYDLIVMGYWVDKGAPNAACIKFMNGIKDKTVVLFQTLGAANDASHALVCAANGGAYLGEGCHVIGVYSCQGAISSQLIETMKRRTIGHHKPTPELLARWASGSGHPDVADCEKAKIFIAKMVEKFEKYYQKK